MDSKQIVTEVIEAFVETDIFKIYNKSLILLEGDYKFDFELPQKLKDFSIKRLSLSLLAEKDSGLMNDYIRYFELSAPVIAEDKLMFKIDHHLSLHIQQPFQLEKLAKPLTSKEKEVAEKIIIRLKSDPMYDNVKFNNMSINCHWSYIYFQFNSKKKKFVRNMIELKSIG